MSAATWKRLDPPLTESARELEIEPINAELASREGEHAKAAKATKLEDKLADLKKRLGK